jgi:hypothetical protein
MRNRKPRSTGIIGSTRENAARTNSSPHVVGFVALIAVAACGSSNSERPYLPGTGPVGTGGSGSTLGAGGVAGLPGGTGGGTSGASGNSGSSGGTTGSADAGAPPVSPIPTDGSTGLDAATVPSDTAPPPDTASPSQPVAASCPIKPVPACDGTPPPVPAARPWKNLGSNLVATGNPQHRGHDLFFVAGQPQWLLARFSYAPFDAALTGEEVEVFLQRNCAGAWESLGVATTTSDGAFPTTEGVEDNGGRLYVPLPVGRALGPGRHRVHFIVAGDGSRTDQFIEVVPAETALAVVDIDGTLTTSETAEFGALLTGQISTAHPDAAAALRALVDKGYRPYYLTARPEWLVQRTREFLATGNFPPGVIETTTAGTGASGAAAQTYKTAALMRVRQKRLVPWFGIGNTDTDAAAYATAIPSANRRYFLAYSDDQNGGKRFEAYADLIKDVAQLPSLCR